MKIDSPYHARRNVNQACEHTYCERRQYLLSHNLYLCNIHGLAPTTAPLRAALLLSRGQLGDRNVSAADILKQLHWVTAESHQVNAGNYLSI